MKVGISIKIDVSKIDKSRLFKGEKGVYLDLTTFVDLENKDNFENNGFISQSMTKDERDSNATKTPILGNCKVFYNDNTSNAERGEQYNKGAAQAREAMAPVGGDFESDGIPF